MPCVVVFFRDFVCTLLVGFVWVVDDLNVVFGGFGCLFVFCLFWLVGCLIVGFSLGVCLVLCLFDLIVVYRWFAWFGSVGVYFLVVWV